MYADLAILAAFVLLYSLLAERLDKTPSSGAIIFVAFGFLFGADGLGVISFQVDSGGIRTLAELTLALVLFTDAANANLSALRLSFRIPERLLLLGLPLTILLGFAAGYMIFDQLSLIEIALLATILAPTDAALGEAVITNKAVPTSIREGLNVESGLNDGICVPVLLVFLAFAVGATEIQEPMTLILGEFARGIGIGAVAGLACSFVAIALFRLAHSRGWVDEAWSEVPLPALALTCFATAQYFGGSGFIACFVGGLLAGWLLRKSGQTLLLGAEAVGSTLALLTWVAFGAAVVGHMTFAWESLLYAVLSLTVIRMLPVFVSLSGLGLSLSDKLFLGWFGPRGLASIVFIVIVLDEHLPGEGTLQETVVMTVILSVLAHGLSANPLARRYGGKNSTKPS